MFAQGGAEIDECAVLFVECAQFGLKGWEEPSLKRLPEDVYGLKGFVECLSRSFHMDIITYCGATFKIIFLEGGGLSKPQIPPCVFRLIGVRKVAIIPVF